MTTSTAEKYLLEEGPRRLEELKAQVEQQQAEFEEAVLAGVKGGAAIPVTAGEVKWRVHSPSWRDHTEVTVAYTDPIDNAKVLRTYEVGKKGPGQLSRYRYGFDIAGARKFATYVRMREGKKKQHPVVDLERLFDDWVRQP